MRAAVILPLAAAVLVTAAAIVLAAEPTDRAYDLRVVTMRVALDVIYEDESTPYHAERYALAQQAIRTGGDSLPQHLGTIAEANSWSTAITWDTVTRDQLRTAISGIWTDAARAKFSEE